MAAGIRVNRATAFVTAVIIIGLVAVILPLAQIGLASQKPVSLVVQAPPTGTYFDHLVFIIMENAGISDICGSSLPPPCDGGTTTPYMAGLANTYGIETQYVDLAGSSQPNYIGIMAATLNGCSSGCGTNSLNEVNLVDRFETAGLSWKAYMEDQTPMAGCDGSDHGFYEVIHNPFLSFTDIFSNSTRCNKIVLPNPSSCSAGANGFHSDCTLINDLNSSSAPNFAWLTPNDCNNMHGNNSCSDNCKTSYTSACNAAGNNYLANVVPAILGSNTFKNTRAALFITFDEGSGFCPSPNPSGADCMYTVWAGPTTKTSFASNNAETHYFFTKTIETNWGLATMTGNDAAASAMSQFFPSQPADFSIGSNPSTVTALASAQATSTITLNSLNSFSGTVTLTASSSPTGPTLNLNPTSVTLSSGGSSTSTLTITTSTTGNYTVTVTGTSGSLQHTTIVTDKVQDYSISSSPTSIKTNKGTTGTSTITITPINHFTGTVTLSVAGTSGLTTSISPTSISGGSGTATLSASSTSVANYTATITSTSGTLSHQLAVQVQVVDFTMSATNPNPVNAGSSATSTITITALNHFIGTVTLTDNIPAGLACSPISPTNITGSGTATVSCNASSSGNYTLTITGTSGSMSHSTTALFVFQDFNFSATPTSVTIDAGSAGTSSITVSSLNGFVGVVALSTNSTSCSLTPISITGSGSSTLSCTFSPAGIFHVGVTGTSGSLSHSLSITYTVQNFSISASPTSVTVNNGSTGTSTITITSVDGFSGIVNLATNTTSFCSVSPASLTGSGSATLSCTFTSTGTKHVSITGTSSPLSHSTTVTFIVQDFSISANPTSTTVNANTAATSTITVTAVNGFSGIVNLATNSTSCSVSPASVTGSGTTILSCTFTTAGTFHVSVTGTSASLSHSTVVTIVVEDFAISATSTIVTVNAGSTGTSTITVTALNGFTGVVTLTSNSTSCSLTPTTVTGSGNATLSCTFAAAGTNHVSATGTSLGLSHSVTIAFAVQDFAISASPTSVTVNAGSAGTSSITVTSANGFAGVVALATNSTSCSVSPVSTTGPGTASLSCAFLGAGTNHVSVTGASGSLFHSVTVTFVVQDFTLVPSPTSVTVNAGSAGTSTVSVTGLNGFAGVVALTTNSTSCSISPSSVTGPGTSSLSCTFTSPGTYHVSATGTNASLSHTAPVTFVVRDFTIAANPTSVVVNVNSAGTSTINIAALNGFNGIVNLATNTTSFCTLNPASVTGSGSSSLSCTFTSVGNKHVSINGISGSLSHSATVTFVVQDYTIVASPTSVNVNVNSAGVSTITVSATNGFSATVSLTTNSTFCNLSPSTVNGAGSSTLSCTFTTVGTFHVSATGSSGTLSHSATVTFAVQDFTISTSTPSAGVVNTSVGITITVTPVNQFSGIVSLTDVIPTGLSCGSIVPNSIAGSGTATVSCTSTSAGDYSLAITGTSASLVHNVTVLFGFDDFTVSATSPANVTVKSSTISTITVAYLNGFTGTVTLTDIIPAGLACGTISPGSLTNSGTATVSCSSMTVGNYTLTITANATGLVHSTTAVFMFGDFTIAASAPAAAEIGQSASSTITITPVNHFTGTVSLSTVMTMGLFCTPITPTAIAGSGSAALSCSAGAAGSYQLQVKGTIGSVMHSTTINFQLTDFSVASNPSQLSSPIGTNATSTITVFSLNGYSGRVNATAAVQSQTTSMSGGGGGRPGIAFAPQANQPDPIVTPASVVIMSGGSGQYTVTIFLQQGTLAGNYTIVVTVLDGTVGHSIQLLLTVQDFSLTGSSNTVTISPGSNSTLTLTFQSLDGYQSTLNTSTTISPTGPTATVNPSIFFLSSSSSSQLTITVSLTTALGNYTLTVQAISNGLSHSIIITIIVSAGQTSILTNMLSQKTVATTATLGALALLSLICIQTIGPKTAQRHPRNRNVSQKNYQPNPTPNRVSKRVLIGPIWSSEKPSDQRY